MFAWLLGEVLLWRLFVCVGLLFFRVVCMLRGDAMSLCRGSFLVGLFGVLGLV